MISFVQVAFRVPGTGVYGGNNFVFIQCLPYPPHSPPDMLRHPAIHSLPAHNRIFLRNVLLSVPPSVVMLLLCDYLKDRDRSFIWLFKKPSITSLTFINSTFCPHCGIMGCVWISEETAIISLYNINWLVFVTQKARVYCAVRTGYTSFSQNVVCRRRHYECTYIDICELFVDMFRKLARKCMGVRGYSYTSSYIWQ